MMTRVTRWWCSHRAIISLAPSHLRIISAHRYGSFIDDDDADAFDNMGEITDFTEIARQSGTLCYQLRLAPVTHEARAAHHA